MNLSSPFVRFVAIALMLCVMGKASYSQQLPEVLKKWQETISSYEEMEFRCKQESRLPGRRALEIHSEWHSRASEYLLSEQAIWAEMPQDGTYDATRFICGSKHFRIRKELDGITRVQTQNDDLQMLRKEAWENAGIAELSGERILRSGRTSPYFISLAQAASDGKCLVDPSADIGGHKCVLVVTEIDVRDRGAYVIKAWLDVNAGYLPLRIRVTQDGGSWMSVDVNNFIRQELDDGRLVYIPRSGEVVTGAKSRKITIEHALIYQGDEASKWKFPDISGIPAVNDNSDKTE